jgi:hypothetical protein
VKANKEMSPLALTKDDFERFGEQFKEIIDDVFHCMVEHQEGMNRKIREEMAALHQLMEETKITSAQQTIEGPMTSTKRLV